MPITLRPARLGSPPPLRVVPGRRMGARHARHLGPRLELRRRRARSRSCGTGLRRSTGSGAAGRLPRGAAVAGGGSRAGRRPVPYRRGRHQRRGQSRRGGDLPSREAATRLRFQVLVYPALLYGSDTESMRRDFRPSTGATSNGAGRTSRTRTTEERPGLAAPRRAPRSAARAHRHRRARPAPRRGALRREAAAIGCRRRRRSHRRCAHGFFSGTDERTTGAQRLVAAALGRAFGRRAGMIDRPAFPDGPLPGIGIVGCGQIVRTRTCRRTPGTAARSSASTTFGRRRRAASARGLARSTRCWTTRDRDRRHRDPS